MAGSVPCRADEVCAVDVAAKLGDDSCESHVDTRLDTFGVMRICLRNVAEPYSGYDGEAAYLSVCALLDDDGNSLLRSTTALVHLIPLTLGDCNDSKSPPCQVGDHRFTTCTSHVWCHLNGEIRNSIISSPTITIQCLIIPTKVFCTITWWQSGSTNSHLPVETPFNRELQKFSTRLAE